MLGGDWTDGTMTDFKWRHFQGDVILWAVRWYCRYPISYRDLEEMLAERGISVDHTTIYRWVQCYAPERSEEHTSELQSLMRISYAVFCLKKKKYKLYIINLQISPHHHAHLIFTILLD